MDIAGAQLADEIGGAFVSVDVTDTEQIEAAVKKAVELGPLRVLVNSAGIGWAQRTVGRAGQFSSAHNLDAYKKVIAINLIGTFDCIRLAATAMSRDGERRTWGEMSYSPVSVRQGRRRMAFGEFVERPEDLWRATRGFGRGQ
jgi:NAD(P)-dependent dehydrogenase (short-subunit alcohol dehydrogenase family)